MEISQANSLPLIRIQNEVFEAEILLQGAQLMRFTPRDQKPWIFCSPNTPYTPQKEIYGGIPVIFPWFGRIESQPEAPNHGFARRATWKLESAAENDSQITLSLSADEVRAEGIDTTLWPYDFVARMIFSFGEKLGLRFEVDNESGEPFRFECALHTYFAVENLDEVRVEGLENQPFRKGGKGGIQMQDGAIRFGELVTQVFATSGGPSQIHDSHRTFHLSSDEGWNSTILWNPGGAAGDLSDEEARGFVCVEAGAIHDGAVTLAPGQTYALDFEVGAQ